MASCHLGVLGRFDWRPQAGGEARAPGPKSRAVLAAAAIAGPQGISRTELADLLWADRPEPAARNALRQCLHQLRASLPPGVFRSDGEVVALDGNRCEVDLWQFERSVTARDGAGWIAAANAYRGELAQGMDGWAEWEQWLASHRERVRALAVRLLDDLAQAPAQPQRYDAAVALAGRLLRDDPTHEGCYRALMRLHGRAGLRGRAAETWEQCRRVLRVELGVEPSEATHAEHERIGRHPAHPGPAPLPVGVLDPTKRSDVQDHLLRGWQLVMQGSARENADARLAFQAALEGQPGHPQALTFVGWTHFYDYQFGWNEDPSVSWRRARAIADRALDSHGRLGVVRALHGRLLLWEGRYDDAIAQLSMALDTAPELPYSYSSLAEARMRGGDQAEALRLIGRAMEMEPNDKGVFLHIEGWSRFCQGDLEAARASFRSAVTRNPRYCPGYAGLAAALAELGEVEAAREAAREACQSHNRVSLDYARRVQPMRDARVRQRVVRAWQLAGVPEHDRPHGGLAT